jgi:hypothetical protein
LTLAARVIEHLRAHGIPGAIVGGVAMALHGIARATADLDVLVVAASVLDARFWEALGPEVDRHVRKGDASDPLEGLVRCVERGTIVDVVVGGSDWMRAVVGRAVERDLAGETLPVVDAADLILLKLYAGGPQDLLDARLLLRAQPALGDEVRRRAGSAPAAVRDGLRALDGS